MSLREALYNNQMNDLAICSYWWNTVKNIMKHSQTHIPAKKNLIEGGLEFKAAIQCSGVLNLFRKKT